MDEQITSNDPSKSNALVSNRSNEQLQQLLVGLMGEGLIRFKDSQPTEVEQKLYLVDWLAMVRDYGLERFQRAVRLAYRKGKFFPKPGDIEQWVEPVGEVIRNTAAPPTADQIEMRGTEEQRQIYREIKAKVEEMAAKGSRITDTRKPTPSCKELAAELAANPLAKKLGWRKDSA